MKKTLKLVAIFAIILVVGVVGALGGYLLISKNKTFYIYDVRLVHPVEDATSYIYTADDREFVSIKNVTPYMRSEAQNQMEIAVYASTSNKSKNVEIVSSNPSVAKIVYQNNRCYVKYLKAGEAVITASLGGVEDSFTIKVYDQVAEYFNVYDYKYYGDYAEFLPNDIIGYSDGIEYAYDYVGHSAAGSEATDELNDELLRIDTESLEKNVFAEGYPRIDSVNQKLVVKCKENLKENKIIPIPVQSYIYDDDGNVVPHGAPHIVNIEIITYVPEFLQVVLATTPDFEDAAVFMNTEIIPSSGLTEESIHEDKTILNEYLSYKKAENNLIPHGETAVYKTLFTEKVSKIYVKFRKVYTNGDIVYLNGLETKDAFTLEADMDYLKMEPTKDFYRLDFAGTNYFDEEGKTFDIKISLKDYDLEHTFKFEFADLTSANLDLFYDYDETLMIYTYKYWDARTRYNDEIYNEEGKIIGFGF